MRRLSADERHRRRARIEYADIITQYEQEKKHRHRVIGRLLTDVTAATKTLRGQ